MLKHKQELRQLASAHSEKLDSLNKQHMSALQRRDTQLQTLNEQHQSLNALNRHDLSCVFSLNETVTSY